MKFSTVVLSAAAVFSSTTEGAVTAVSAITKPTTCKTSTDCTGLAATDKSPKLEDHFKLHDKLKACAKAGECAVAQNITVTLDTDSLCTAVYGFKLGVVIPTGYVIDNLLAVSDVENTGTLTGRYATTLEEVKATWCEDKADGKEGEFVFTAKEVKLPNAAAIAATVPTSKPVKKVTLNLVASISATGEDTNTSSAGLKIAGAGAAALAIAALI